MIPDMNHHGSMVRHHVPICFSMFFPINWPYLGGYCHISHQVAPCSAAALACHGTRTPTRWRSVWRTSKPGRSLRTHGMGFGWAMPAVWHFFWNILFGKPIRKPVWSPFDKEDVLSIYIYNYIYIYDFIWFLVGKDMVSPCQSWSSWWSRDATMTGCAPSRSLNDGMLVRRLRVFDLTGLIQLRKVVGYPNQFKQVEYMAVGQNPGTQLPSKID